MKVLAGLSPILFHATEAGKAVKILKSNSFILVNSNFSGTESKLAPKEYDYFLSTARNRNSGYISSSRGRQVIFTLDGRKLGQKYKGNAVDYWGENFRNVDKRYDEQEDRVYSKTPKIPNAISYIKEISYYLPEMKPYYADSLMKIIESANAHDIPVYVYEDAKAFFLGNKKRAVNMQDVMERLSKFLDIPENKYEEYDMGRYDGYAEIMSYVEYINILEYIVKNEIDSFSDALESYNIKDEEIKKEVKRVHERARYPNDFINILSGVFQNARNNMTERTADASAELTKVMRKYKVNSFKELYGVIEKLMAAWNDIDRRKRYKRAADNFWNTVKAAGFSFDLEYDKDEYLKNLHVRDFKYTKSGEITQDAWKELLTALYRVDSLGYYDIWKMKIYVNDTNNQDEIARMLETLEFSNYGGGEYSIDRGQFTNNVYDKLLKKTTAGLKQLPVVSNDSEHQETLEKTGFWGKRGAGCIFVSLDTKRILLAHRSQYVEQPNTYGTWGGALDGDESFEEGVRREITEETNYKGRYELVPLFLFKHPSGFQYQNYMAIVPKEFRPHTDWENQGYEWCDLNDLPHPLHDGLKKLLADKKSVEKIKLALGL